MRARSGRILDIIHTLYIIQMLGWSGGAVVLGKLPVPGRPTYLVYSRTRA